MIVFKVSHLMFLASVLLLPSISPAETVMFQNFETPSGWNGASPPANWTIIDNGAADGTWDNYDWYRLSAWGGQTARVSGAPPTSRYNNDWLISQSVDFGTATACTLFYRHYYDDVIAQSADSALVLLSIDGGATWGDTAAVYAGADFGSDSVPDSEYFNISSFVAGHSDVRVAFQYVKRQPIVAGSWRIDNIKFMADGSSLMHQDFESAWGPYGNNPPASWAINDINVVRWDENDWHQASAAGWGNVADVYWTPVEQQNEMLVSETVDFTLSTHYIRLYLKQWYDDGPDNADSAMILGSIDGGSTWPETLAVYRGADRGSLGSPSYDTLYNIEDWANSQNNVKFGFKYVGNDDGRWYLDSIRVDRIDMFDNDVTAAAVSSPAASNIEGYAWPVSAIVENVGLNTVTFSVSIKITDTTGATVYNQVQNVNNLSSLEQRIVAFPTWTAAEPYTHNITCFTSMIIDEDHSNDTLSATTYTYPHVGSGGPIEGWSFKDNITGAGPAYQWIDISSTGTEIVFTDSDNGNSGMLDMIMDFEYFWSHYNRISVSVDGWLSFVDSTSTDNSHSAIPDVDGPSGIIALLWSNLQLGSGHIYYHFNSTTNQFIVQYDSVEFVGVPGSYIEMEVIFGGDDNSIKMQYRGFADGPDSDVTIGIENQAEDIGLPYNNDGEPGQMALPGLAITYKYLLPHDIRIVSIDQPNMLLVDGDTYDIVARFRNAGAGIETFTVTAQDNFGFNNSQVITNLASLDSTTVTFPGWTIANECSTYTLTAFAGLVSDLDHSNDTLSKEIVAISQSNFNLVYDNEVAINAEYGDEDLVIASEFIALYGDAAINAVAFKFTNDDFFYPDWPDSTQDSVDVFLFLDDNGDGTPNITPSFSSKIQTAITGWTIWNVACETTFTINCGKFWVGFANDPSPGFEALCLDGDGVDYPDTKWNLFGGIWQIDSEFSGDFFIRPYLNVDPASAPNLTPETSVISGAALPYEADTVSTFIQNTGTACDLTYRVSVIQTITALGANRRAFDRPIATGNARATAANIHLFANSNPDEPNDSPVTLDAGGPDVFGYTWFDSDEPDGPDYYWLDITSLGAEVTWDHGNANDGHTEPMPMGMTFSFYGANYESIVISSNGWVSFMRVPDDPLAFSENNTLPLTNEIYTMLAVDWDNLDGGATGHCYYYHDVAANSFIVSWVDWSHVPYPSNPHSFQVILNATDGTILYQYNGGTYQDDITIGIENEVGDDGLMVTYNQPYLHNDLAVLFSPPIFWLWTDLPNGVLPALSASDPFNIYMYAHGLPTGTYSGAVVLTSNDIDQPVTHINVQFEIEGICAYVPGDVNGSGAANGIDVTYMVSYFKGGSPPHEECLPCSSLGGNMLYPQGDVNGNCAWNGIDVTFFVAYLKGIGQPLRYCDFCAPAGGGIPDRASEAPVLSPGLKLRESSIGK